MATAFSELAKKAWLWLGQTTLDDVAPARYELEVHALTSEKYAVILQAVYTVGPRIADAAGDETKNPVEEPLLLRAKLAAAPDPHIIVGKEKCGRCPRHVRKLLERHVGAVAAGMTMGQVLAIEGCAGMVEEALRRVNRDLVGGGLLVVYRASVERLAVQVRTDRVSFAVVAEEGAAPTPRFAMQTGTGNGKKELEVEVAVNHREATVAVAVVHPATKEFGRDSETTVAGVGGVLRIGLGGNKTMRLTISAQQSSLGKQAAAVDQQVKEVAAERALEQERAGERKECETDL